MLHGDPKCLFKSEGVGTYTRVFSGYPRLFRLFKSPCAVFIPLEPIYLPGLNAAFKWPKASDSIEKTTLKCHILAKDIAT
jgi:hypothetical protein